MVCEEVTDEEAAKIMKEEEAKKAAKVAKTMAQFEEKKLVEGDDKEDDKEKGVIPNAANGSKTDKYEWGQALDSVDVNIWLEEGFNTKQLAVNMSMNKLTVKNKVSGEILLEGTWFKPIMTEDSIWCIETDSKGNKFLQLNL